MDDRVWIDDTPVNKYPMHKRIQQSQFTLGKKYYRECNVRHPVVELYLDMCVLREMNKQ